MFCCAWNSSIVSALIYTVEDNYFTKESLNFSHLIWIMRQVFRSRKYATSFGCKCSHYIFSAECKALPVYHTGLCDTSKFDEFSKLVQTCLKLFKLVETCPIWSRFVQTCLKISKLVWSCSNLPKIVQIDQCKLIVIMRKQVNIVAIQTCVICLNSDLGFIQIGKKILLGDNYCSYLRYRYITAFHTIRRCPFFCKVQYFQEFKLFSFCVDFYELKSPKTKLCPYVSRASMQFYFPFNFSF